MSDNPITVTLTKPLAGKVRAAAQACGLSPNDWVEMVFRKKMEEERGERTARIEACGDSQQ